MHDAPPLGLIAGNGKLPLLTAEGMRDAGRKICCVGLIDQFDADLPLACDHFATAGIIRIGRWIKLLRQHDVKEAIMVGGVRKANIYQPMRLFRQLPDMRAAKLWYRVLRDDRRDQNILTAVADELATGGITLIDSTQYIPDHLAGEGVLTKHQPTESQWADIRFGWPMLSQLADMDVGQAMAIKDRDIIAVEAIEGTDRMIRRAGRLCRSGGWVLLKSGGSHKDMRFDVPVIGVKTIEQLAQAKAKCVAVKAGGVILLDKPKVLEAAEQAGVCVVGVGDV